MNTVKEDPKITDLGDFFNEFVAHCVSGLQQEGVADDEASRITLKVMAQLVEAFRGQSFYISKRPATFIKWVSMYHDLKTMPHSEVDKKYRMSIGYSLKIKRKMDKLKKQRENRENSWQGLTSLI